MTIERLNGREYEPQVQRLLGYAQIHLAPEDAAARGPAISEEYVEKAEFTLWGWSSGEEILGLIGIEDAGEGVGVVRDLAVDLDGRGQGIGRALISHAFTMFEHLAGDTLASAAGFYRSCGFEVTVNGVLPDGRELLRFTASNVNHAESTSGVYDALEKAIAAGVASPPQSTHRSRAGGKPTVLSKGLEDIIDEVSGDVEL